MTTKPELAYFEPWLKGDAVKILQEHDAIDLKQLLFSDGLDNNHSRLSTIHGYHLMPRTELDPAYHLNEALLARMPNLLAASSTGAGYDMIDVDACTQAGIIVCNQSGSNKEGVAEHAFGLMLCFAKKIVSVNAAMHAEDRVLRDNFVGTELAGKTLGIVGIGQIGTRVAEIANVFHMNVRAFDPYVSESEAKSRGAEKVDWETLWRDSDYVTVHCPRNDETLGMIGGDAFSLMKDTAIYITTARGGIHDEEALKTALENNQLAGAGLDVWDEEPTPLDHPLLELSNVIATPHSAGITVEAMQNMETWAAQQWIEIFEGKVPPRIVNPDSWDKYSQRFEALLGRQPDALE